MTKGTFIWQSPKGTDCFVEDMATAYILTCLRTVWNGMMPTEYYVSPTGFSKPLYGVGGMTKQYGAEAIAAFINELYKRNLAGEMTDTELDQYGIFTDHLIDMGVNPK